MAGLRSSRRVQFQQGINEPDFLPVHVVRKLAQAATLVCAQRGKLVATPSGKSMLSDARTGDPVSSCVLAHGPGLLRPRVARVLATGRRRRRALVAVGLRQ